LKSADWKVEIVVRKCFDAFVWGYVGEKGRADYIYIYIYIWTLVCGSAPCDCVLLDDEEKALRLYYISFT